ncbi:MAG: rRNA maturation RNase YbeY [Rhizobiales bacterium]|nr:rRNA maturation RNase YbeY [Hyphomicrobiales bacterium]
MRPAPKRRRSVKTAAKRRGLPTAVDIQIASPLWRAQPQTEPTVRAAIAAAAALSTAGGEVSILLTDDKAIRALNRDWRGIDKATNVLSFPAPDATPGAPTKMLGDIVMAYETLAHECDREARAFLHHLAHLTVHGFLHLIGYDHRTDSQADAMEGLESKIMTRLKMPDPYLARDLVR